MDSKREKIFQAMLELIVEQGFHAPMSTVAARAGVGAGTLYRYFKNKEHLIDELATCVLTTITNKIFGNLSPHATLAQQFAEIWNDIFAYCNKFYNEVKFLDQYICSPYSKINVEELHEQYFAPMLKLFRQASKDGVIKKLPQEILFTLAFDPAIGLAKKQRAGLVQLDKKTIDLIIDACWDAIKLPKTEKLK